MLSQFFNPNDLGLIMPMVMLSFFGLSILLTDFLLESRDKKWNAAMALIGVAFSAWTLWGLRNHDTLGFNQSIRVDSFFVFFGFLFLASAGLTILISVRYLEIEGEHHGEFYSLILFATVGMMFLACGNDLVVLFLGLETMAIAFYILTGFLRRDKRSNEGALKYILLGAFSSGILAYGFSILFGLAGSTNLKIITLAMAARSAGDPLVLLALVTVSAGIFFKIAAVPFHQWAPDVYEGAPTSITAFVSVASKAASFALLLRLFLTVFWPDAARLSWEPILAVVALATMTWGNFAALTQSNVKRLLAYSSIAHVGYILLGIVAAGSTGDLNETGLRGVAYYLFAYAFMNTGAFTVILLLRRKGLIGDELDDLRGLYKRSPAAAVLMLIFLLSLAGIPPTAGFIGKYFIFLSLIETQHYLLAVFAALYIVPAVYYYFRMIVPMWLSDATDTSRVTISPAQAVALFITLFFTLAAGVYPEPFIRLANYALLLPFGR